MADTSDLKHCPDCGQDKALVDFYRAGSLKDGRPAYRPRCKACDKIKTAEWREAHPERRAEHLAAWRANRDQWRLDHPEEHSLAEHARKLKYRYGMTVEEYDALVASQDRCCAICTVPLDDRGHVDHEHETGKVRGVLCQRHNMALGLMDDDPVLLRAAADYIERHR